MLFSVPRTRLDLLPFYARFVATLHPVVSDVALELGQFLKQDFKFHVRKKVGSVIFFIVTLATAKSNNTAMCF
jgi:hypothetical protein